MQNDDLTLKVLVEIRDGVRGTNERVDHLTERVDHLTERVDTLSERVGHMEGQIVESETRTATAITELAGTVNSVHTLLREQLDLRDRVARCERDIDDLKRRVREPS